MHGIARLLGDPLELREPFARADAIVVLGGLVRDKDGGLSRSLHERMTAGVALWNRGAAPIFCVTGRSPKHSEADGMAARAIEMGVDASCIQRERRARNTFENAQFVADLLRPLGCQRVWIVTQPYHLRRAVYLFRHAGMSPLPWHIADSIQYDGSLRTLRWIAREYAAFPRSWLRARHHARHH